MGKVLALVLSSKRKKSGPFPSLLMLPALCQAPCQAPCQALGNQVVVCCSCLLGEKLYLLPGQFSREALAFVRHLKDPELLTPSNSG